MEENNEIINRMLSVETAKASNIEKIEMNESIFRWMVNEDQMSNDKLSDGIRKFAADIIKLEKKILPLIEAQK